jgi:hypothetical protein
LIATIQVFVVPDKRLGDARFAWFPRMAVRFGGVAVGVL